MFTVYILESIEFWRYYIWYSHNVNKRLEEHNNWFVKSTKFYKPYKIIRTELFETRWEAMKREKEFKRMKSSSKFKEIVSK